MDYIRFLRNKVGSEKVMLNFAGGIVLDDEGRILLQKRREQKAWGFPGGALDLGESLVEAAKREILEETGFHITIERLSGVYSNYEEVYPNGDVAQPIVHFFVCRINGGQLTIDPDESLNVAFFEREQMPGLYSDLHQTAWNDFLTEVGPVFR
ncbi:NUDIX hydrolase [Exiguobacterium sp. TDN 0502]|uniref:NUDIX hydrolase n=1 Tax=Exiguobacterium sp. TDN 0502 TaxID=3420731 RepID=UPI003D7884E2